MKNICFVANFEKTDFFLKISNKIPHVKVFWICVNLKEIKQIKRYYKEDRILYLKKDDLIKKNLVSEFKINELLFADRALNVSKKNDKNFLINAQYQIINFIKVNKINYIFSEFTWAHEVLINLVCNSKPELNCKHYNPGAVRIIPDRFLFFKDLSSSKYYFRKNNSTNLFKINENHYKEFIKSHAVQKKIFNIKFIFEKIFRLFHNDYYDKDDPRKISKFVRINNFVSKYFNFVAYNLLKKKKIIDLENTKFVIYFLQKKPEASTDVKGIYYSDHLKNIENIWKILPTDFHLIVKQHPSCTGDNNLSFYKKIIKFQNVHLLNELSENNFKKIKPCATFSINSTASIETALHGIPSFTFANCFFNDLKFSKKIYLEDFKNHNLLELIELIKKDNQNKKENSHADFLKSSYSGYIYGEQLLNKDNINKVAHAIYDLIS